MTVSPLAAIEIPSPNRYAPRAYPITKITVHHMAGDLSVETCGAIFQSASRSASSNYGIDSYGRIGCYVREEDAAWTSANWENDNRAITIEVADEDCTNWVPSDAAYRATVQLCADVCTRYGIVPNYDGTPSASFTEHMMFAPTGCPCPWWHSHMYQFIDDVKREMEGDDMPSAQDVAEAVWGYNYKGTARQNNMYDQDCVTYDMVKRLEQKVDTLSAKVDKIGAGNVDYKALAKAVCDEQAARMKA